MSYCNTKYCFLNYCHYKVRLGFTIFPQERPSFQVYEPLENSLHALDSDNSLLLQLLRGYTGAGTVRLSWLRHLATGRPAFPFNWTSYEIEKRHDIIAEYLVEHCLYLYIAVSEVGNLLFRKPGVFFFLPNQDFHMP